MFIGSAAIAVTRPPERDPQVNLAGAKPALRQTWDGS